tara:strand:+ start:3595 stop:5679 length:2085 start_codon:yes stop_codon:yes gene_type:complete
MPAVSKKQQRFFGMVRAAQKGEMEKASPEVSKAAASMSKSSVKKLASTKHKGLPMKKFSEMTHLGEEGYDRMRDRRLEQGTWKSASSDKPRSGGTQPKMKGKTVLQKQSEKKYGKGKSALDIVKADITAKYGKGAIMNTKKEEVALDEVTAKERMNRDAGAIAKKKMRNKEHKKYVNFLDVDEATVYTGPKKGDLKGYGSKAFKEYEKNMDPKKRQALKDKATKGMKFTHEEVEQVDEVVKMSRKEYAKIHKDFKSDDPKKPRTTKYNEKTGGTESHPVEFTDSHQPEGETIEEKKGLWDNIHAKRKRGEKPAKPGDKDYPKTLNVEAKVDEKTPDYKRATVRDKRYGNPHRSFELGGGIRKDRRADHEARRGVKTKGMKEETINERGDFWHPDPEKDKKLGGPGANQRAREDRAAASKPAAKKEDPKKLRKGESYMDYAKRQKGYKPPAKKKSLLGRILGKEEFAPIEEKHATPESGTGKYYNEKKPTAMQLAKREKMKKVKELTNQGKHKEASALYNKEEIQVMSFGTFLTEGNRTGRMLQKSKTQVTGHISADRGTDEKKNREGRKGLEKDLKKHGIGHKKGVGEYKYGSGEGTGREVSYQTSKPDKMSKRRFGKVMRRLGRKHGQESVITKDKDKSAKLHYTEKGSKAKSDSIGKSKAGKHPEGYGETSGTKVRSGKLPKKTNKGAYHYG